MERIGYGGVGIGRAPSNQQISSSIVVNNSSSGRSKYIGEPGSRWASRLTPVSLSTIVIDRVPRDCLSPFRRKRASRTSSRRGFRPTNAAAASFVSVSPVESSCVQVGDEISPVGGDHGSTLKPQPRRRSRTRDFPRSKRKSVAVAVGEGDSPASENNDLELQRLAEALESAYHKDATTNESDYESILKDLAAQTRIVGQLGGALEAAASCSAPTMSSAGKRRGRPPRASRVDSEQQQQSASVVSPQTIKDGFVVRSKPSVVVKRRAGDGKCRLNLMSRIALRKRKQDRSLLVNNVSATVGKLPGQDIWSEEAENLIVKNGVALELGIVNWEHLKRGLLSAEEESELAFLMKPVKTFEKVRTEWSEEAGRDPTDEEWAAAAQVDVHTLRRHIHLGKAARNKLIQFNLRLVLSQANKYNRESSCLSLSDLCQEGVSGLLHAVDKFDPKRGLRFSTYAVYWVRNSILRAQTRSGNSLRSPYNVAMHNLNIKRARLDLLVELERAPTDAEVMERLGLTAERFRDIIGSSLTSASMNRKSAMTGEELVDTVADESETERVRIGGSGDDGSLRFGIDDVLDTLKPREGLVLRQRFGLDGNGERTLGEIGETLGVSREMVRKYESSALMKMKHPTTMDYLRSYLS